MTVTYRHTLLCLAFLLVSCASKEGPLWMRGLALPPGAVEVRRSISTHSDLDPASGKGDYGSRQLLTVEFNGGGDWAAVSSFMDAFMEKEGYQPDAFVDTVTGNVPGGIVSQTKRFDIQHRYWRRGARFEVTLTNILASNAEAKKSDGSDWMKVDSEAQYRLEVRVDP